MENELRHDLCNALMPALTLLRQRKSRDLEGEDLELIEESVKTALLLLKPVQADHIGDVWTHPGVRHDPVLFGPMTVIQVGQRELLMSDGLWWPREELWDCGWSREQQECPIEAR